MIEQLDLTNFPSVVNWLYDLATIGGNVVPDDFRSWIMEDATHRDLLRKCRDKKLTSAQIDGLLKIVEEM